jgi:hypothetical protein
MSVQCYVDLMDDVCIYLTYTKYGNTIIVVLECIYKQSPSALLHYPLQRPCVRHLMFLSKNTASYPLHDYALVQPDPFSFIICSCMILQ